MFEEETGEKESDEAPADDAVVQAPKPTFDALEPGEVVLDDGDEHYLRQCNPSWLQDGRPTSQAFAYFKKDEGRLSGNRTGGGVTPAQAFTFYTQTLKLQSAATFAVTVDQVEAKSSRVVDDTNAPTVRPPAPVPPGHSYIDLRHLTNGERKKLASKLSREAIQVHPDITNQINFSE